MKNPLARRSNKSIDHTGNFAIPKKSEIAIVPPKKVIKALYDYDAPTTPPLYLSFRQDDYLHVVGREDDQDWYEACNPIHGHRGLVPVKYFEVVGKTVRHSTGSAMSASSAPHDSGYSDARSAAPSSITTSTPITPFTPATTLSPTSAQDRTSGPRLGPTTGAMVYGIVAYDFHAERPDELDAKEGEAIIVIAQSNPEWLVAKPITRLGGPGLIPISFIELKDMQTRQTIQDTAGAIQRAGIPRVEEWKKMAFDYKNTSIPLGHFESTMPIGSPQIPGSAHSSNKGFEQAMQRMSLGNRTNSYGPTTPYTPGSQQQPIFPRSSSIFPVQASVPRCVFVKDKFHFMVECTLSNGSRWELSRKYEDFYELQINLINAFPNEAGKTDRPRVLPYMPGPVKFVTAKISEGRRVNLNEYLENLLLLEPHITRSPIVCDFFVNGPRDTQLDPSDDARHTSARYSHASERSQAGQYSPNNRYSHGRQRQNSHNSQSPQYQPASSYGQQQQLSTAPPQMQRQTTALSMQTAALKVKVWFDINTCVVVRMPPKQQFNYGDLYRKILERRKLEYTGKKDSGLDGAGAYDDDREPDLEFKYRDEATGDYHQMSNDKDLDDALARNEKLTIAVTAITT